MNADRLQDIVCRFPECRIAVLGDFFLDKYLDVDPALAEISVETGKIAHQVRSIRCSPGAAGTVVNNLAALGAGRLHVLGFTGDDGEGYELRRALQDLGCGIEGLLVLADRFTPTYLKPRAGDIADLSGEHERYDTKNRQQTPADAQARIVGYLERLLPELDAVIIVDQVEEAECGVVTTKVRDRLATLAKRHTKKIFWTDSRRRIGTFRNVIIKVNSHEAVNEIFPHGAPPARDHPPEGQPAGPGRRTGPAAAGASTIQPDNGTAPEDGIVRKAMTQLRKRTGRSVFVTAGRRGIWIDDPRPMLVRGVRVPEPTDPTGAGDSATAGAVLALCSGAGMQEAALLANLVASITVQQLATTGTASPDRLGPRLEDVAQPGINREHVMQFAIDYLEDLKRTLSGLDPSALGRAISWMKEARDNGRMVFVCGNGGSAAIASQLVTDMVKGASYGHKSRFRMIGLTDSIGIITAYANDVDYDCVFAEQLRNFAQNGDVLLAISGSGNSRNVLRAVEYAHSVGCRTIGLTQSEGGRLKDLAQLTLGVPNHHMGRLEDCFFVMTHVIAYAFMEEAAD